MCAANGVTAMLSGIMRGCGRQKAGAWVNGLTNYAVGLPLQLLFAFRLRGGVTGLWWGLAAAAALQALVLAALVSRFDWRQEADRADVLVRHLSQSSSVAAAASQPQQPPPSSGLPSPEVAAAPPLF